MSLSRLSAYCELFLKRILRGSFVAAAAVVVASSVLGGSYARGQQSSASGEDTRESSGPYCGLYALYSAATISGVDLKFEDLLREEYLSSAKGSTADDLTRAAKAIGVRSQAFSQLSSRSLQQSASPVILHVKSNLLDREYDHWIVYLGTSEGGLARLFDPPRVETVIPFSSLEALWDGYGLIISKETVNPAVILRPERRRLIWYLSAAAIAVLSYHVARWKIARTNWFCHRGGSLSSIMQAGAIVCMTAGLAGANRIETGHSMFADGDMVIALRKAHFDDFDRVTASQLRSLSNGSVTIVDARYPADFNAGHIANAISIPIGTDRAEMVKRLSGRSKGERLIVYCQSLGCPFAKAVATLLSVEGYSNIGIFGGGWLEWVDSEHESGKSSGEGK